MKFSERLEYLINEKNISIAILAEKIGYGKTSVYYWLNNIREPNQGALIALSNFFDVSIDYLVGRTDELDVVKHENSDLTPFETELIKNLRKLDSGNQHKVFGYCYALAN